MDSIKILTGFLKTCQNVSTVHLGKNARIAFKNMKNVTNDKLFLPDTKSYFKVQQFKKHMTGRENARLLEEK